MSNSIKNNQPFLWGILALGALIGFAASFVQTVELISFYKNPIEPLQCNINAIFSCSNVFGAWQSSVFGFSNSLMCIVFFVFTLSLSLAVITGSDLNKKLRLASHGFSLFFLGFGAWYLWQSAYKIGSLCIFCIACYSGVILINWAWLRINKNELRLSKKASSKLNDLISKGADTFFWILWAISIAFMLAYKFY